MKLDSGHSSYLLMSSQANKITLNIAVEGKFAEIIRTALEVLAVVVEVEGSSFHQSAEEVLVYLHVRFVILPCLIRI